MGTLDDLAKLPKPKFIAIDLETTGLNPLCDSIVGVSYAYDNHNEGYTKDLSELTHYLEDSTIQKIFHNAVFDLSFLKAKGVSVSGVVNDTMILAHLVDPDRDTLGLKDLAKSHLGEGALLSAQRMFSWLDEHGLTKKDISKAPPEVLEAYAIEDARNTYALFVLFCQQLRKMREWLNSRGYNKTPWEYYIEEMRPLIPVVVDMQLRGVKLNLEATAYRKLELTQRQEQVLKLLPANDDIKDSEKILYFDLVSKKISRNKSGKLKKTPPPIIFNWDSNDHLKVLFFDVLKLTPFKKTFKGNDSVDSASLEVFKNKLPWIEKLIEYRENKKIIKTYLDNLLELQIGGNIHANFHITGTTTGRFSSSNPNLQNIPKHGRVKELFVPRSGFKFIYADYSQLELRVAAHLSGDPHLLSAYNQGIDLHQLTADTIGVGRDLGKTINFAIIYNASGWRIKDILNLKDANEGDKIKQKLFGKYRVLKNYLDKVLASMLKLGVAISEFGMVRRLPKLKSTDRKEYNHALKAGFNMPIQSFGASLCKRSMIELHRQGFHIVSQIHDSIILESDDVERDLPKVKLIMENIYKLKVPLVVEPKVLDSFEEKLAA